MKVLRSLSFVFGAALAFALQLSSAHAAITAAISPMTMV